jgi:hypothetical protein
MSDQSDEGIDCVVHFPTTAKARAAIEGRFRESYWTKTFVPGVFGGTALQIVKPWGILITVPTHHVVYDACVNGRIPPSPLLADLLIHVGLGVPLHGRYEDHRGLISDLQVDAMCDIVEHASTMSASSFRTFQDICWNEPAFRRMVRWFCHPDPLVRDVENLKMKLRALENERLGASLSRRETHALWELKHDLWRLSRKSIPEFLFECDTPSATRYPLERSSQLPTAK